MIDLNFYEYLGKKKLSDIIKELNQKTEHQITVDYKKEIDDSIIISGLSNLESATKQDIAVFHNENYLKNFALTNAICCLVKNVSIRYSIIGDDVVILDGAKIGHEGFGFATEKGVHYRIFHFGKVIIGNDVEIGANTTIDRGSSSDTVIEDCCRIGNLTLVAHNVRIGKGSILVGHIAIAGSSKIGRYCVLGGQVGIAGHLSIADMTTIAAQSCIIKNVETMGQVLGGTPAIHIKDWHRQNILLKNMISKKDWIK